MITRGGRRVFLGVQWDSGSWDDLPSLCGCLLEKTGNLPIHWNFPAPAPDCSRKTRAWLEKTLGPRLASGADAAVPMGFAGACHPFLNLDELEKELAWAVKNPWGTGTADLFGLRPSILLPRLPDLARTEAVKLYAAHGFGRLGVCSEGAHSWFGRGDLGCFTCSRLPIAVPDSALPFLYSLRRLTARRRDLFLMLDLSGAGLETLREAVDAIAASLLVPERASFALIGDPPKALSGRGPGFDRIDWSPFPDPILRRKLGATAGLARRKRKKNDDYRDLLNRLSPAAPPEAEPGIPPAPSRMGTRLVAQMLGEVVLAGNVFDVKLAGGRFSGIVSSGREVLPSRAALSYLRVGGRTWPFQTRNSFSFEGDGGTGLREELAIDARDGSSLTVEYTFRDDCPMLQVTAEVRWPVIAGGLPVEEHAPFVISLRELDHGETAVVEAVSPDGSVSSTRIQEAAWLVVPGAEHRIPLRGGPSLVLRPATAEPRDWSVMSFRIARDRRRRILEVNPFGGWAPVPADLLSGKSERFALLVGLDEGPADSRGRR